MRTTDPMTADNLRKLSATISTYKQYLTEMEGLADLIKAVSRELSEKGSTEVEEALMRDDDILSKLLMSLVAADESPAMLLKWADSLEDEELMQ